MTAGPVAAYGLFDGWRWLAWVPCTSISNARKVAQAAVAGGQANRYVLYDRTGLAVEEGTLEDIIESEETDA